MLSAGVYITLANEAWDRKDKWKRFWFLNVSGKQKPLYFFQQNQKQAESLSNTVKLCVRAANTSFQWQRLWCSPQEADHFIQPLQQQIRSPGNKCLTHEQPSVENPSTEFWVVIFSRLMVQNSFHDCGRRNRLDRKGRRRGEGKVNVCVDNLSRAHRHTDLHQRLMWGACRKHTPEYHK